MANDKCEICEKETPIFSGVCLACIKQTFKHIDSGPRKPNIKDIIRKLAPATFCENCATRITVDDETGRNICITCNTHV